MSKLTKLFSFKKATNSDEEDMLNSSVSYPDVEKDLLDTFEDEYEGQLSVDVYHDDQYVYIKSTIAGVTSEDLDIAIEGDMVTLRGKRSLDHTVKDKNYLYQECYWGAFSRSILLPFDLDSTRAEATLKNGILTLKIPKINKTHSVNVRVDNDEE